MDIYKQVTKTVEEHESTLCDICGCDIDEESGESSMPMLIRDVTISYEHGESWPDDSDIYYFEPDICPKCFREKIYPHIIKLLKPESLTWSDWTSKPKHDCMDKL